MNSKFLLLLLIALVLRLAGFCAVFTVTSNSDSGAGTLREAIKLASENGFAEKDFIVFNLPGNTTAERTISILSSLTLSSNMVIDGTTQPGISFGVSNAKIIIQPGAPGFNGMLLMDTDGFELYGCYIRDFNSRGVYGITNPLIHATAIYAENARNIQIGAPGKGNVVSNNGNFLFSSYQSLKDGSTVINWGVENLKVYSNTFGLDPDGKTIRGSNYGLLGVIDLSYCKGSFEIGGSDISMRNIFAGTATFITGTFTGGDKLFNSTFLIQNNYFGYDVDGKTLAVPSGNFSDYYAVFFWSTRFGSFAYPYSFKILDNKIQAPYSTNAGYLSGEVLFQGNTILDDNYPGKPGYRGGVGFGSSNTIKIGGEGNGEGNSIHGEQLRAESLKSALVQHTTVFCYTAGDEPFLSKSKLLPVIDINKISGNMVSGTASPKSRIELFWDDDCQACQPLTYFATVDADDSGYWKYDGAISKGVIATATLNGFTSLFTNPAETIPGKVSHSSCGTANGSITGLQYKDGGGYEWRNEKNEVIGNGADIANLGPGKYSFRTLNGSCSTIKFYEIVDVTPVIKDASIRITQPSCDKSNGSITNLEIETRFGINYEIRWMDISGKIRSSNSNLLNVESGTYYLEVSYNNCIKTYGPILLKNLQGPAIDPSGVVITHSKCTSATGSITNIKTEGTGNLSYVWRNSSNVIVGNNPELLNVPAGKYTLELKDGTSCPAVISSQIEIEQVDGILMDESKTTVLSANCQRANGSISGIVISGATVFKWMDENNNPVGNEVNLLNAPPGKYRLLASNSSECFIESKVFQIIQIPSTSFNLNAEVSDATCSENNGSISITVIGVQPSAFRWTNSSGISIGSSAKISSIGKGNYSLYVTDVNHCEVLYREYTVSDIISVSIDRTKEKVTNDQCGQSRGSIKAPALSGGQLPYFYEWRNAAGIVMGNTALLQNMSAGDYYLTIGDALTCGRQILSYTVENTSALIQAPIVKNLQICSAGKVRIEVSNPDSGIYSLYDEEGVMIAENSSGSFSIEIIKSTTFAIGFRVGTCQSQRTPVSVTISDQAIQIPNTITPNGDGINDNWNLNGLLNYPDSRVKIFDRYGQIIFDSIGYFNPFKGVRNGKELPAGTYFYIIDLGTSCSILKGNLTLIR